MMNKGCYWRDSGTCTDEQCIAWLDYSISFCTNATPLPMTHYCRVCCHRMTRNWKTIPWTRDDGKATTTSQRSVQQQVLSVKQWNTNAQLALPFMFHVWCPTCPAACCGLLAWPQLSCHSAPPAGEDGELRENKVRSMATQLLAKFEENSSTALMRSKVRDKS